LAGIVLANVLVQLHVFRWDLTDDKLYSLSDASKNLLDQTDAPIEATVLLNGDLSAGFKRLRKATIETLEEMRVYAHGIRIDYLDLNTLDNKARQEMEQKGFIPTRNTIVEHSGKTVEIRTYPYVILRYHDKEAIVNLLSGAGQTEEEVTNAGIEQLEYNLLEPLYLMQRSSTPRVAILEGHDEAEEQYTYDLEKTLSDYFQVDRGSINGEGVDLHILDDYQAIIIANPQSSFGEAERYIIDQYIMRGGKVLWAVDGVRFSNDMLHTEGFTPIIEHEIGIKDMLFRYGICIDPALVQDVQCLKIPVQAPSSSKQSHVLIPWTYAPLLQSNPYHPITHDIGAIMSTFVSPIRAVNDEDGIEKFVLLYTSTATKVTRCPNEVNLSGNEQDWNSYEYANVPVAASMEGVFPSVYAHRMMPEGVIANEPVIKQSTPTRQIVIGSGSVLMNNANQNQIQAIGFDPVTGRLYSNRDFITNAMLWLTDEDGLIRLREKIIPLRMLNTKRAYQERTKVELISIICPIAVLALIGGMVFVIRKRKYALKVESGKLKVERR
jgi:gliding-associated putative ABC transporter substrate-binding component GldG